jgi:glycosyltransferase involved in cell wall biosynthesis
VRDEEVRLGKALASLSAQTVEDFEAIVVDDGSRDRSAEVAAAHVRRDARFRVLRQPPLGFAAALERGRAEARGRVIACMNGDDVALPGRLEAQVAALTEEGLDACGGRVECFPRSAVRHGMHRYERWLNGLVTVERAARDVFVECPLPHPALAVRRNALAHAGGWRDCGWPDDYDLVLRLWAQGARFRNVEEVVLRWREHEGRLSRTSAAYSQDAFVRCKVHYLRATLLHGRDAVVWGAGPVGKSFARELARQGTRVAAFVDVDPRKIGHRVYGAPVVSVEDAPRFAGAFALGAVAGEEGRRRVREVAAAVGRVDGFDFVAVA